jgi:hypothetical protein
MRSLGARGSLISVIFLLSSCVVYSPPHSLAAEFSAKEIGRIYILPVADLRTDKSVQTDRAVIDAEMATDFSGTGDLSSLLDDRGYGDTTFVDPGASRPVTFEDLANPSGDRIGQLGPSDARWLLQIALLSLVEQRGHTGFVRARCSGHLFDKQIGMPVWVHGLGVEVINTWGPALRVEHVRETLNHCARELIEHFPPRVFHLIKRR